MARTTTTTTTTTATDADTSRTARARTKSKRQQEIETAEAQAEIDRLERKKKALERAMRRAEDSDNEAAGDDPAALFDNDDGLETGGNNEAHTVRLLTFILSIYRDSDYFRNLELSPSCCSPG
jgi:hypothetical protein